MAKDDLTLGAGLIRKGQARGLSPSLAVAESLEDDQPPVRAEQPAIAQPVAVPMPAPPAPPAEVAEDDPPLRPPPPDDIPKRFTSFRLPVSLDEDLRSMIFETRRTKQDLLIEFVTAGIERWRQDRARRR